MVQSFSSVTNNLSNCTRFSSNDTKGWVKGHFYFQMRQLTMETVLSSTEVGGYVTRSSKEHHGSPCDGSVKSAGPLCCHT